MITIELPWPDKRLSPNARVHWAVLSALKEVAKGDAWWATYEVLQGGFHLERAEGYEAQYIFAPPDKRKRDIDNCLAMMKAAQDGVCEYYGIDDSRIKRTILEWGDVVKGGKVVLTLEELGDDIR